MKNKGLVSATFILFISVSASIISYAGEWKSDAKGYWYQEDNGDYPVSTWRHIDGKDYYFDSNGYMLANTTTPDGYKVGADGAWIQENEGQFKVKDDVLFFLNASYEETKARLQNVERKSIFGSIGDEPDKIYHDYQIIADNLPYELCWRFNGETEYIPYGDGNGYYRETGVSNPVKLVSLSGTMNQIYDGLDKDTYTIAEFEELVKKAGATDVKSADRYETGTWYIGVLESHYSKRIGFVSYKIGNLSFFVDSDGNKTDDKVFYVNETPVSISIIE